MKKIALIILSIFAWSVVMATDFNSAPAAVKTTVLKYGTAESIIEFEEDVDENDLPIYIVTLQKGSIYTYLTVSKAGKLISKEEEEVSEDEDEDFGDE